MARLKLPNAIVIRSDGRTEKRSEQSDLGGTMRLGGQVCKLAENSLNRCVYGQAEITERHRHPIGWPHGKAQRAIGFGRHHAARWPGVQIGREFIEPARLWPG